MEEQHPIPQQISSYQFRLVGDMTIKQFFQVAGGALVALIIYSSSLPAFMKWPLIIMSFLFGIALAFFPIGNRPLSKWLVLFFKAIYSPTIYVWRKSRTKPVFFQAETEEAVTLQSKGLETKVEPIQEALETISAQAPELGNLEKKEAEFLSKVSEHLENEPTGGQILTTQPSDIISQTIGPSTEKMVGVEIPKESSVEVGYVEKVATPPEVVEAFPTSVFGVTPMSGQKTTGAQSAKFSLDAAPPTPPTKPNIIVGQVVSPEGKIVEAAILEIRDTEGRPVRALKTNKLGHFMIVTPLGDGKYEIMTEKEGLEFDPISIEANGQIIPPIAIWAKRKADQQFN